jgi:hypothetical protein
MKILPTICGAAAVMLLAQNHGQAASLTVVNVNAPAVNCVFDASCTVVVNDSVGNLTYTQLGGGARLQSRTYPAKLGTPGAGNTAYEYRVDLTQGISWSDCISGLVINFGPVTKLTYPPATPAHVFVISSGGLGDVGIGSAEQNGDVITFTFSKLLCAGHTSFFFGLASTKPPVNTTATLFGIGTPPIVQTDARAPQH